MFPLILIGLLFMCASYVVVSGPMTALETSSDALLIHQVQALSGSNNDGILEAVEQAVTRAMGEALKGGQGWVKAYRFGSAALDAATTGSDTDLYG